MITTYRGESEVQGRDELRYMGLSTWAMCGPCALSLK